MIITNVAKYTIFKQSDFNAFPLALFIILFSLIIYHVCTLPSKKKDSEEDGNSVFVPMSIGMGYTFNLNNKWVLLVLVIVMALLILQYLI